MEQYIEQYTEALANAKAVAAARSRDYEIEDSLENYHRRRIANAMVVDMREMLRWAKTGYDPRTIYADTRISAGTVDPSVLDKILTNSDYVGQEAEIGYGSTDAEQRLQEVYEMINKMLDGLTDKERTAFTLHRSEHGTLSKVAEVMGVTVSSVRVYIRRAEAKIAKNKLNVGLDSKIG